MHRHLTAQLIQTVYRLLVDSGVYCRLQGFVWTKPIPIARWNLCIVAVLRPNVLHVFFIVIIMGKSTLPWLLTTLQRH